MARSPSTRPEPELRYATEETRSGLHRRRGPRASTTTTTMSTGSWTGAGSEWDRAFGFAVGRPLDRDLRGEHPHDDRAGRHGADRRASPSSRCRADVPSPRSAHRHDDAPAGGRGPSQEPVALLWASESLIYGRFGYGSAAPRLTLSGQTRSTAFLASVDLGDGWVDEVDRRRSTPRRCRPCTPGCCPIARVP